MILDRFVAQEGQVLLAFLRSRLPASEAEDVLQEVLFKAVKGFDSLQDQRKLKSWVYQITRAEIANFYRRQFKSSELDDNQPAPQLAMNPAAELEKCLPSMISQLPEPYQNAIRQSELSGLPHREIALRENKSVSAIKSRIQRGREKLKELYQQCCDIETNTKNQLVDYEQKKYCEKKC